MARSAIFHFSCGRVAQLLPIILACCLLIPAAALASNDWTGRWEGSIAVSTGPSAGEILPCEFTIAQNGPGFTGTATCPGLDPVSFSGAGTANAAGTALGGIKFEGSRDKDGASGTWKYPDNGSFGIWTLKRRGR
jgi:hypothetical protein